ncbi:hypothetical protein, partial [Parasphingorhabdus sp.]|uniref:hypothetical protein n=1 Tax=Parasphingorhabdus sp. TaxID=2709688 RepID=UPI003C73F8C1
PGLCPYCYPRHYGCDPEGNRLQAFATAPVNRPENPAKRGLTKVRRTPNGRGSLTSNWYGPFV